MNSLKKYIAEFIGTFILVTIGCGTAMLVGCDANNGCGYVLTALAFGLAIVAMAYSVGNISGGHVNPAVSCAVFCIGELSFTDLIGYIIAQCLGAFAGSGLLALIFSLGDIEDKTGGYGTNGFAGVGGSAACALIVEIVLTFIFIMNILGVTSKNQTHGSFGGLIIGLTLVGVHILGIGLTGTSVNPARSLGPAIVASINGNSTPMSEYWPFLLGPIIGGCLAAFIYKFLETPSEEA